MTLVLTGAITVFVCGQILGAIAVLRWLFRGEQPLDMVPDNTAPEKREAPPRG